MENKLKNSTFNCRITIEYNKHCQGITNKHSSYVKIKLLNFLISFKQYTSCKKLRKIRLITKTADSSSRPNKVSSFLVKTFRNATALLRLLLLKCQTNNR